MPAADLVLLPALDTDPLGYNAVVAGRVAADAVAGPAKLEPLYEWTSRSVEVFLAATGERGAVTVHTSPFFRRTFLTAPFLSLWHRVVAAGATLVLHAHEDRPGRGTYYDDATHLDRVIGGSATTLRRAGLSVMTFRSGYCAFSSAVIPILETHGLTFDLSAAPGIYNSERGVDWRGGPDTAQPIDRRDYRASPPAEPSAVITIPMGWDGDGHTYAGHYLFNELNEEDDLMRVCETVRFRARVRATRQVVLFLCHSYGMCDPKWSAQAARFLDRTRDALAGASDVRALIERTPTR